MHVLVLSDGKIMKEFKVFTFFFLRIKDLKEELGKD